MTAIEYNDLIILLKLLVSHPKVMQAGMNDGLYNRCMHSIIYRLSILAYSTILMLGYKVIIKISMSKTCLYNFSYKKATGYLQQPVTIEGIWLQFSLTLTLLRYAVE